MAPLFHDLKVRLARAVDAGGSARQVAARFDVSPSRPGSAEIASRCCPLTRH